MWMEIRLYDPTMDEIGWVRCRVLSFLDTAYFDHVLTEKEKYQNPAIELVAIYDHQVVGLLDIEYEKEIETVCTRGNVLGGMIWHIATHPDYQRMGIGTRLLEKAEEIAKKEGLDYLDRKSTRLNSSHVSISITLSLHDALPISGRNI